MGKGFGDENRSFVEYLIPTSTPVHSEITPLASIPYIRFLKMAPPLTNYIAFVHPDLKVPRIGHLNWDDSTIKPLSFTSGTPLENLYQVIQAGQENLKPTGHPIPLDSVQILPPIS